MDKYSPSKTIAISGGDSWVNKGDEAILAGTIKLFKEEEPELEIKIISGNKKNTKKQFPEYDVVNRKNLIELYYSFRDVDALIYGGGHLIQNTSSKIFLVFQYFIILNAIIQKKKIIGFSLGAEKIEGFIWKKISKWILNHFSIISVRDKYSLEVLEDLDLDIPLLLTTDPAVVLDQDQLENELVKTDDSAPFIIISPRKWFDYKSSFLPVKWQRKLSTKDDPRYINSLCAFAKTCDWIIEEFNYKVVFISMYSENEQGDDRVARNIRQIMTNKSDIKILNRDLSPQKMIHFMQKAEFLIGMRMHATILGACANLPIIALYYQTKGKSFFESLSIENYAIPIEEFEFPEIQSIIRNLILDRDKLKNKIRDVMVDLRELARLNVNTIMKYINSNE